MKRAQFASDPTAVAAARRMVAGALRDWAVPAATIDDTELVVSELVTNALVHGRASSVTVELDRPAHAVTLAVEHDENVAEADGGALTPQRAPVDQTHGRGLAIVDVLAREWHVEAMDGHRRVWCLLAPDDAPVEQRFAPLNRLTEAIAGATTERAVGDAVTDWASTHLRTDFSGIALAEDQGRFLRYLSVEPLPAVTIAAWAHFPADTEVPVAAAFRLGKPYFYESGTAAVAAFPLLASALDGSGMSALAQIPLGGRNGPIGTLSLSWKHGRLLDAADRELIQAVARLATAGLERIRHSGPSDSAAR